MNHQGSGRCAEVVQLLGINWMELRGVGVSWINRGEDGAEGVRGVVGFIGDEDWLIGLIFIFSMSS